MLELIMREWRLLVHERPSVMFVLVCAASAYALLIGNLYKNETVQNIPVAVCDLNDSPLSRELIKAVMDADQYDYRETLTDEFICAEKLRTGELAAVLIIPEDFAKKFYTQQPIDLAFVQDGANTLQAGYAASPMQQAVGVFAAQFATNAAMSFGTPQLKPSAISVSVRTFGNPTQSYLEFYVYGVMLMATQIGMIMGFSMSMYEDFNAGFFDKGNVEKNLAAKSIFYLFMSFGSIVLGMFFLARLFNLPFKGDILTTIILCLAFLFVVENLSGIAALFFRTKIGLCQAMVFYTLPAFLISGYIWPEIGMFDVVKWLSYLQPVHYIAMDFRDLTLVGENTDIRSHVEIFWVGGALTLMTFYALLKYKIAVRRKRLNL